MPITKKEKRQLTDWLRDHDIRQDCPACGAEAGWQIHESIIAGLDLDLEKKKASPSSAGFFALACKNCRHVMFFAAAPILGK
jgi:hypothetical protein